jgi:hypothetical protein
MFIREPLPKLQEHIQGQLKKVEEQIAHLEQQSVYLKQQALLPIIVFILII